MHDVLDTLIREPFPEEYKSTLSLAKKQKIVRKTVFIVHRRLGINLLISTYLG